MDKYWSSDVVDLDIERVAHINSGSYREEEQTHQKRNSIQYMASMHQQYDDMAY
jgi:hypothetical protein